jgi:protein TonB
MASWTYPASGMRWSNGVGAALTVGIHVLVIALLLAARATVQTPPSPINVAIISDAPHQQETLESVPKPHLDTPTMHVPQPDIVLADDTPSSAPIAVATSAPQAQSSPTATVTQPIFDADYLNNPAPAYPPLARRLREQGVVLVRVLVSSEGLPDQIELKHSSGSARLDEAALCVVKKWRFIPAKRGGQSVAAWVVVPISFSLTA